MNARIKRLVENGTMTELTSAARRLGKLPEFGMRHRVADVERRVEAARELEAALVDAKVAAHLGVIALVRDCLDGWTEAEVEAALFEEDGR